MRGKALVGKLFISVLSVMMLVVAGFVQLGAASAASGNDVIHGGVSSNSDLINKYRHGDGHNNSSSIQAIFREAISVNSASDLEGLRMGHVHKNGQVSVDGEGVVATDARSVGRHNFGNSQPLGSTGAFIGPTQTRFNSSSLRSLVKMVDGEFRFAVIMNCGNPVRAVPKPVEKKVEKKPVEKKVVEKEVIVEKIVEKPVIVEKIVEKPVVEEKIVEKPVVKERVVEKPVTVERPPEELPKAGPAGALGGSFGLGLALFSYTRSKRKLLESFLAS